MQLQVARPIARASGRGSKTIGPFAFHGKVSIRLSCTGRGNLNLEVMSSPSLPGVSTYCPELGDVLGPGPSSGRGDGHAQIKVDVPARVHWTVAVQEIGTRTLTAPAKVQGLPIRRSGVGSTFLGIFAVRGTFYVKAECVGTGTFAVYFGSGGTSSVCNKSLNKPAVIAGESGARRPYRTRIWVRAPAGMNWTLTAAEGQLP